jgi:CRISPR-associated protein Cas6/Cse3/CasE subtype I-E
VRVRTQDNISANKINASEVVVDVAIGNLVRFDLRCAPEYRVKGRVVDLPRDNDAKAWLSARAPSLGFSVKEIDCAVSEPLVFRGKHKRKITLNDTVMTGILTIKEPQRFCNTLISGVGRHKGFGFGFLIVNSEDK